MRFNTTNVTLLSLAGAAAVIGFGLLFTFERLPVQTVHHECDDPVALPWRG